MITTYGSSQDPRLRDSLFVLLDFVHTFTKGNGADQQIRNQQILHLWTHTCYFNLKNQL